jgi:hypothetical protein
MHMTWAQAIGLTVWAFESYRDDELTDRNSMEESLGGSVGTLKHMHGKSMFSL